MRTLSLLGVAAILLCATPALAGPPANARRAPEVQPDPGSPFARDARAEVILGRIGLVGASVQKMLDVARKERDVVKLNCLADKRKALTTIEAKARGSRAELRDADDAASGDAPWNNLVALGSEATRLGQEARNCVGHEAAYLVDGVAAGLPTRDLTETVDVASTRTSEVVVVTGSATHGLLAGAPIRMAQSTSGRARGPASAPPPPPPSPPLASPPPAPATPPQGSQLKRDGAHDASMLLRSAQLSLAVFEVDKKMDAVEAIAKDLGGYLALRGDRELTVRVPRERFDEALRAMEKLGDVLHKSVAAEDVTDQYVDLELRLRNALAVRARLEKLLETATVRDAVEIHKELAKVTDEIERLEGKLKLLKDRIAFSTITVSFERTEPQRVRSREALLPFPWMRTMGLAPLLQVNR